MDDLIRAQLRRRVAGLEKALETALADLSRLRNGRRRRARRRKGGHATRWQERSSSAGSGSGDASGTLPSTDSSSESGSERPAGAGVDASELEARLAAAVAERNQALSDLATARGRISGLEAELDGERRGAMALSTALSEAEARLVDHTCGACHRCSSHPFIISHPAN